MAFNDEIMVASGVEYDPEHPSTEKATLENISKNDLGKAYTTDDSASTTINDTDYIPMSDSNGNRKKSLWSTIVDKIKTAIWKANTSSSEGYVASGSGQNNKAWRTDDSGNPAWRDYDNLHFSVVSSLDANTIDEDGIWYVNAVPSNVPVNYYGVFWNVKSMGTPFQMFFPDAVRQVYKRWYTSGAWTAWQLIEAGDSTKLPLAGGTMTGDITYKHPSVDASKANNNVSSTQYPTTFNMLDVSNRIYARMEGKVQSNGNIGAYWYVRNYNTSGGQVAQKGIEMTMAKDGTFSYGVSDADKFRSAISAAPSSGSAYYLRRDSWWSSSTSASANDLRGGIVFAYPANHNVPTTGTLVAFDCNNNGNYGLQIQGQYNGENLWFRNRNGDNGTYNAWRYVIHNGNIGSQSVNYATSAGSAGSATTADKLNGFTSRTTSAGWGVQTGTVVTAMDVDTCAYAFRKNCPSSGKLSMVIDGYFYQNEGLYACLDTNNYSSYALAKVGGTMTGNITRSQTDGTSYIAGVGGLSALYMNKPEGARWYPVVGTKTAGGGGWAIGNYNDEKLQFAYGTKANIASGTNTVNIVTLDPQNGTIITSANYSSYAVPKTGGTINGGLSMAEISGGGIAFHKGSYYVKLGNMNLSGQTNLTDNHYVYFQNANGTIGFTGSSRRIKENIRDITEEEAKKILEINVVKFDYKEGWGDGGKNRTGFIAEDVLDIIPEAVQVSENYDSKLQIDPQHNFPPEMDYQRFIPYLTKMIQIQEQRINALEGEIRLLKGDL